MAVVLHQLPLFSAELSVENNGVTESPSWAATISKALAIEAGPAWPDRFGVATRAWFTQQNHTPIKSLSLFSGGGGLDIGFADSGFESIYMVELDHRYVQTLQANSGLSRYFEHAQPLCLDIKDFVCDASIDFIIGGPPCQTFSAAGRRAAGVMGTTDPRGRLFEEYVRIVSQVQPRGFLFENVYGITGAQQGEPWKAIQRAFEAIGYIVTSRILDTADYGVPQHRERLIIVGLRDQSFLFPTPTHGPDSPGKEPFYTAGVAVQDTDRSGIKFGLSGQYGHLLNDIPPGLNYSYYTEKMGHPNPVFGWRSKFSDFLYKADPSQPVRTIKAQGGQYTGPFSWENRPLSVGEFKRLQTIPDTYRLIGTRQTCIQQIGNSVPPQFVRILALSILHQVFSVPLPIPLSFLPEAQQLTFRQRKRHKTQEYVAKAQTSIASIRNDVVAESSNTPHVDSYTRFISKRFQWTSSPTEGGREVSIERSLTAEEWTFKVAHRTFSSVYEIIVQPRKEKAWKLPTNRIGLQSDSFETLCFTSLWKAFEETMAEKTSIADLVQLNGYYHYQPRIASTLHFMDAPEKAFWFVIQQIVAGNLVAQQLHVEQLARFLHVLTKDIFPYMQILRAMGFRTVDRFLERG